MHIQDVLPRDAIPPIDDPEFETEYFGEADDKVIVVETTPARAYPVRILSYHEIVNDVLEDEMSILLLTVLVAYGSFLLAEHYLGMSGILSVVGADC